MTRHPGRRLLIAFERLLFGRHAIVLHGFAALALFSVLAVNMSGLYFRGSDGYYYSLLASVSSTYVGNPLFSSGPDPLQGMGGVIAPFNPWLSPPFLIHVLADNPHVRACGPFVTLAAAMFLSIYALGRATRFSRVHAMVAAWLGALLAAPLLGWSHSLGLNAIPFIQIAAIGNFALACYAALGRSRSWGRNLALGAAMTGLGAWAVLFSGADAAVGGVTYALLAVGYTIGIGRRHELFWKACWALAAATAAWATGLIDYLLALPVFSARVLVPEEMTDTIVNSKLVSLFSLSTMSVVAAVAIAAACGSLVRKSRRHREIAISLIFASATCIGVSVAYLNAGGWRLPAPYQFEYFLIGTYSLFFICVLFSAPTWIMPPLRGIRPGIRRHVDFIVAVSLAAILVVAARSPLYGFIARPFPAPWSTATTPLSAFLQDAVAISPGATWRGSVVSYIGRADQPTADRPMKPYHEIRPHFGNDHAEHDLRIHGIPTIEYNSPFIMPTYFIFMSKLMMREDTPRISNAVFLARYRPRILKALGVRYMVDDTNDIAADIRPVRQSVSKDGRKTLYLYDLGKPNVGDYSPTQPVVRQRIADAIETLDDPGFDFRNSVVVAAPLDVSLVPARQSRLTVSENGFHVEASADDWSVLVLPLQYSHCLAWTSASDSQDDAPQLLQANLIQTGILFKGRISGSISYKFAPLSDAACRYRDRRAFDLAS